MIPYLVNSTLCLGLLLAIYQLFLEKEKMHHFNRFYLLFSVAFSLLVPLISFTVYTHTVAVAQNQTLPNLPVNNLLSIPLKTGLNWRGLIVPGLIIGYAIITILLLLNYLKGIYLIVSRIAQNEIITLPDAKIVMLEGDVISYTFLNYIFVSKHQYNHQNFACEVLSHELAHVRQKHTLDILFSGLVQLLFWFNPIIILYKKAIRLNHEFLADEAVINTYTDIKHYQLLLINTISLGNIGAVTSSFNYGITKKRLLMMSRIHNRRRAFFKRGIAVIVVFAAAYLFSTRVVANRIIYTHPLMTNTVHKDKATKPAAPLPKLAEIVKPPEPVQPRADEPEEVTALTVSTPNAPLARAEFTGCLVMEDSVISLYITKYTTLAQLTDYRRQLSEKNISLNFSGLKLDENNYVRSIKIAVDCRDGFSGSCSDDFEPDGHNITGFYRSYQKNTHSPFGTGRMADPTQADLKPDAALKK